MNSPIVIIENFTEEELKCKCGCNRFNYDNEFLIKLQTFRYLLNKSMTVTSGCRCIEHNKEVKGKKNSCHICEGKKTTASDVTNNNCEEIYNLACKLEFFNEVLFYKKLNFVHLGIDRNQTGNCYNIIY